jgi:hypothetical protein
MIVQAILDPSLLARVPHDGFAQKLFCNLWIGIFFNFLDNFVIISPNKTISGSDYDNAVNNWPIKYRSRIKEIILKLQLRKRFIKSSHEATGAICSDYLALSIKNKDAVCMLNEWCHACSRTAALHFIDAFEFFSTDFYYRQKRSMNHVLTNNAWKQSDFEKEILKPIFSYAKHIKIFDRYIGRSVIKSEKRGSISVQLHPNYTKTLTWIMQVYQSVGGATRGGIVEIYCGIKGGSILKSRRHAIHVEIANLAKHLTTALGTVVNIILKEERHNAEFPHCRYLVTDQVAILIDRGFDLLWSDDDMKRARLATTDPRPIRDVAVALCGDCSSIEAQTKSLPNFNT